MISPDPHPYPSLGEIVGKCASGSAILTEVMPCSPGFLDGYRTDPDAATLYRRVDAIRTRRAGSCQPVLMFLRSHPPDKGSKFFPSHRTGNSGRKAGGAKSSTCAIPSGWYGLEGRRNDRSSSEMPSHGFMVLL